MYLYIFLFLWEKKNHYANVKARFFSCIAFDELYCLVAHCVAQLAPLSDFFCQPIIFFSVSLLSLLPFSSSFFFLRGFKHNNFVALLRYIQLACESDVSNYRNLNGQTTLCVWANDNFFSNYDKKNK